MKKNKKIALGLGALSTLFAIGYAINNKKEETKTAEEIANENDLVKYEEDYFPVSQINAQNMELNLTAREAQNAINAQTKQGAIVTLSIKQIIRMESGENHHHHS